MATETKNVEKQATPAVVAVEAPKVATLEPIRHNPLAKRDPFKGMIRGMVAYHSLTVGRGFMAAEGTVSRTVELADGSAYTITVTRTKGATVNVDPFPRKARKARKAKA